jgi:outer membrane biosynthesis protein TonB
VRQFNAPPGWPDPPNVRWRPPKRWGPGESWPPAPAGWAFWVDEDGRPVRGPIGRYGGPSMIKLGAVAAVVLALIGLVLFNPFTGGDDSETTAAPTTGVETPAAAGTPTAPQTEAPRTTSAPTTTPTPEPTHTPTPTPAPSSTPAESESATPTASSTTPEPTTEPTTAPVSTSEAVAYKNCAEVRAAGKAPLRRGDPGFTEELDRNGDGIACDRGNS